MSDTTDKTCKTECLRWRSLQKTYHFMIFFGLVAIIHRIIIRIFDWLHCWAELNTKKTKNKHNPRTYNGRAQCVFKTMVSRHVHK